MEYLNTITEQRTLSDKNLQKATEKILKLGKEIRRCSFEVAHIIARVEELESYKADGFKTVHDWTKECLGINKTASYSMLRIGKEYTAPVLDGRQRVIGYECNLSETEIYSVSQVEKMLPLDKSLLDECLEQGVINSSMSCKEIEQVVRNVKKEREAIESSNTAEQEEVVDVDELAPDVTPAKEVVEDEYFAIDIYDNIGSYIGKFNIPNDLFGEILKFEIK